MRLYTGFDLHSSNSYVGIIDENGKRSFNKKLPNDQVVIIDTCDRSEMTSPISPSSLCTTGTGWLIC